MESEDKFGGNSMFLDENGFNQTYDQYPNPPTGFKKIDLPKLRDRDRCLLKEKIQMQNQHVNKSLRRYLN